MHNLDALKNWDVHNVKSCWRMLTGAYYLKDISGIKNWNLPAELFKGPKGDTNAMFQYPIPVFNKFTGIINGQSYQMGSVIRLHMNGGTYTYSRTGSKYDDPFVYTVSEFDIFGWKASKLSAYKPVREGHTFLYWNTKQDGTGKTYLPTDMSPVYNRDDCKVYNLYAIWDSPASTKRNVTNSCNN